MTLKFVLSFLLPMLLFITMFGLGLTLTLIDFKRAITAPLAIAIGLICQILILPLVAFGLCHLFQLETSLAIGVMLLALSPGGPTSNLFSKLAGGDVALNLTMTAFNTFISTITMPLGTAFVLVLLAGEEKDIGFPIQKMVEVFLLVFIPVCLGMWLNFKKHALAQKLDRPIKLFSVIFLAIIIVGTLSKEWRLITENFASVGWAVLLFNFLSLGIGYFLPRAFKIDSKQSIAISFEIGVHNAALALFVAISALGSTLMAAPATIYSLSMYITAGTLCWWISKSGKHLN